jgi:hypothetical protein
MEAIIALVTVVALLYLAAKVEKPRGELRQVSRKLAALGAELRSLDQRLEAIDMAVALLGKSNILRLQPIKGQKVGIGSRNFSPFRQP